MAIITTRQFVVLHLWYVEGWSHRRIGDALGIKHAPVQRLIERGRRWIFEVAADEGGATSPRLRALLESSPTSSVTANLGTAACRQEELLDALELLMQQRAAEAATFEECMSGDSSHNGHVKRNTFDLWEMRYAMAKGCAQIPTSAYFPWVAGCYCDAACDHRADIA